MGIYDRDYYRSDGSSFLGSFTEQGKACKWLIALNVLFFVGQLLTPPAPSYPTFGLDEDGNPKLNLNKDEAARFGDKYGAVQEALQLTPPDVLRGQVWRLITYAFLHSPGSFFHILFNMLFLWWFGHEIEEMYGTREFLTFYLVSGFLGGAAYTLWSWGRGNMVPCVGASGAVTAVMVLYAFHFPTRVIYIWFVLPVPIWLFVGFQVVQDAFLFTSGRPTDTAVTVHLAGAAFGFLYYKRNWRLDGFWEALRGLRLPGRRPRLRVYRDEPPTPPATPRQAPPAARAEADEHLEAAVDAVLEKVARHGRDSLTESEKALLVRASEVYKRKQRS